MPWMRGREPIRRTMEYLLKGDMHFKKEVSIVSVNYNVGQTSSKGAYDFVFWNFPQLQYKNPKVQLLKFKNMTPSPFIQLFFNNGKKLVVDIHGMSREQIHNHIRNTYCEEGVTIEEMKTDPAKFGWGTDRWCICEVPGQVPCPGWVQLPKEMRGKYKFAPKDDDL